MKTFYFNAMGSDRTYWDFFTGYSLIGVRDRRLTRSCALAAG